MPTIRLTCVEGHTEEEIRAFMDGATKLAIETLGAKEDGVIVHVEVLKPAHYKRGALTVAQRRTGA